ncbi:DUF6400 family protein [Streptomyces sp. NPDC059766]|uniref:DUF6400 family protein n=1 Tax=Streptomyces sp. NPDC059766 TaxID=3346940 RepID=UPI003654E120
MSPHVPHIPDDPDSPVEPRGPEASPPDSAALADFSVDLTSHEMLRRAHVLDALGSDWDPVAALEGEEAAYALLYSGLDAEQQRVYDELVAAGVLPRRGDGRAAP